VATFVKRTWFDHHYTYACAFTVYVSVITVVAWLKGVFVLLCQLALLGMDNIRLARKQATVESNTWHCLSNKDL
jgi:hypothetical protein